MHHQAASRWPAVELEDRTARWGLAASLALGALVLVALWLRLHRLDAEGLADDEVHKWLAAHRYLAGDFGGDDLEHPMLMKSLIALCIALLPAGWAPEALTRIPNALAGAASIWAVAQLGRRLFGRAAGLLAAAAGAVCTTYVGYQRVAKEDTLVGLFLLLLLWCVAEAKAAAGGKLEREQARWEVWGACALGAMLASKYYFFYAPMPVLAWWTLRGGPGEWRVPARRWLQLIAVAFVVWAALNWTPFLPQAWPYLRDHLAGKHVETASLFFMGRVYENLPLRLAAGMPPSFFFVLPAVKLTPPLFAASLAGIALALFQRRPAHRLMLAWIGFWYLVWLLSGGKYARFFLSVLPAFLLFAGHALSTALLATARACSGLLAPLPPALRRAVAPLSLLAMSAPLAAAVLLVGWEARASLALAPHHRLYLSPLAGRAHGVEWFFPHCDYFDAGLREAVAYIAARAEPWAEISSEAVLPVQLYAARSGRDDLLATRTVRDGSCRAGRVCYVIVQPGRVYLHNQAAVERLAKREPWHVELIAGAPAVKVYRLTPGELPFAAKALAGTR
jgi:4-amino-4-deoxy-L-arabinose transferase-like glycosyltransferase